MDNRRRPAGVTIVAVFLGLIALRGLSRVIGSGDELFLEQILRHPLSSALAIAYPLCALVAAVLLWEMRRGAVAMYAAWAFLQVTVIVIHDVSLKAQGKTETKWWLIILPPVIVALALGIVGVLLKSSLNRRE